MMMSMCKVHGHLALLSAVDTRIDGAKDPREIPARSPTEHHARRLAGHHATCYGAMHASAVTSWCMPQMECHDPNANRSPSTRRVTDREPMWMASSGYEMETCAGQSEHWPIHMACCQEGAGEFVRRFAEENSSDTLFIYDWSWKSEH